MIGANPRRANRLFTRVFLAAFMWRDVIRGRRRGREIVARPGLRFSPLQVFAQRQFQPIPAQVPRGRSGLPLALVLAIPHCRLVRMRPRKSVISVGGQAVGRKSDAGIPTAEMVEFEVMVRPIKAPAALGEEMGNRIGPQLSLLKQAAGAAG
jgi:hypothetical protein